MRERVVTQELPRLVLVVVHVVIATYDVGELSLDTFIKVHNQVADNLRALQKVLTPQ